MGWDSRFRPADLALLIEPDHPDLPIARQAYLLGLNRQAYYYEPAISTVTERLLKRDTDAVDAVYTDYPFYGSRRMQIELTDRYGISLGRARIRTVMRQLGLEAVYPKPNTSKPGVGTSHQVYPYLLRGVTASHPNHIWGTDITYIRTAEGFVYLVAFMDWYSRYVVAWALSDSPGEQLCAGGIADGSTVRGRLWLRRTEHCELRPGQSLHERSLRWPTRASRCPG